MKTVNNSILSLFEVENYWEAIVKTNFTCYSKTFSYKYTLKIALENIAYLRKNGVICGYNIMTFAPYFDFFRRK